MPLYNKRPYVRRAIESIQKQTFTDWELIIVDDGSTDGSTDEIPRNEQKIILIQTQNSGPAAARNKAIRNARGKFITFLDADDYFYPHKLEQEMQLLHEEKLAAWMISAFDYKVNDKIAIKRIHDIKGYEITGEPQVFNDAFLQLKIQGWHISALCIHKPLLERVGGFQESMRWKEITDMQIRCALFTPKVLVYPAPLSCMVDVPQSASKVQSHRMEGMRQLGENLYDLSKDHAEYSELLASYSKKNLLSYVSALRRSGKNHDAIKYLTEKFPYPRGKLWWKRRILYSLPNPLFDLFQRINVSNKRT
jgi:glycosyltransferase involved in cell wall biosynthesis